MFCQLSQIFAVPNNHSHSSLFGSPSAVSSPLTTSAAAVSTSDSPAAAASSSSSSASAPTDSSTIAAVMAESGRATSQLLKSLVTTVDLSVVCDVKDVGESVYRLNDSKLTAWMRA